MTREQYAFYTENFEIHQFKYKTYGHGVWYNPEKETYDEAIDRAKKIMNDKVEKDNPHLFQPGKEVWVNSEYKQFIEKETGVNIGGGLFTPIRNTPPPNEQTYPHENIPIPPSIDNQIEEITDPKVLESFRLLVKGKPHLQELFDNKLKELNNNQK